MLSIRLDGKWYLIIILTCIALKSNDVKPHLIFHKHHFNSWVYHMLYTLYSLSQLGLSRPPYWIFSNILLQKRNYYLIPYLCIYLHCLYVYKCKYHGIRNLAYLIYHCIPHAKISAWHKRLAQYLLNEFFN